MSMQPHEAKLAKRARFRILGPVGVEAAGRIVSLPRRRERCLLAVLLLEANRVVSIDRLAEILWEDDSPKQVRGAVQGHASRLRAMLGKVGSDDAVELVFAGDGYRLEVDPDTVDAHQFQRLLELAATVTDLVAQADQLRVALDLWRGPALADAVGGLARERLCSGLEEQRLRAFEDFAAACLALRREREVLPELARFAGGNPGRERLVELHMLALYQAGRRADALEVYARARAFLADELGLDPRPELRELHRAILRGQLAVPTRLDASPRSAPIVVPRQLPADVAGFTGRVEQLEQLGGMSDDGAGGAASIVISAIDGTAGVGKTALAVHATHRMAPNYPDGQLFIDLHGFTESVAPVEPGDALDRLLRALDVPGERIPVELDDRAALWRSVLAERRTLIVLDNAATEAQVTPLLPGAPGCLVLITSRRKLTGLEATLTISLDTLPLPDALTLFTRTAGEDRLAGQPSELVAETAQLCGRLPLAIRIAAGRLRSHPTWGLAELVERLRDQDQLLSELDDGTRGVAAALTVSYQRLATDPQRMYRLLGLHPGPDIDPYAAAALIDASVATARQCLDQLYDAHLLLEPTAGRFAFHDLVRAHAANAVAAAEPEPVRRAALTRLLDYYRHTTSAAMDVAHPYERERRPRVAPAAPTPDLADPARADGWLDAELSNLLAVARHAANNGWPEHVRNLSSILCRHLRTRGHYRTAEVLHHQALTTARTDGCLAGELESLTDLGDAHRLQGRYAQATDDYQQALQLARTVGHRVGELDALIGLGNVGRRQGRYAQATDHYQQALQLARTVGHRVGELDALIGLGNVHWLQGRYAQAAYHFEQALQIARATGYRAGELAALIGLGNVHHLQGRHGQAIDHHQQALETARATGHRAGELDALTGLGLAYRLQARYTQAVEHLEQALQIARATGRRPGELVALAGLGPVYRLQGRYQQAADHHQQLLELARGIGDRNFELEARQDMGRLAHATGHAEAAVAHHRQALAIATDLGQPVDQARAHDGLAHAYHALGHLEQAHRHWQDALSILTRLDIDHTEEEQANASTIRAHLAALASADPTADGAAVGGV